MTNAKKARWAHDVLDGLFAGHILSRENEQLLRSFLPELPKQKTLTELRHEVWDAWIGADSNEWADDVFGDLETWLAELHKQLQGLESAESAHSKSAHPEFLETEADYENAPEGTIVAAAKVAPIMKCGRWWESAPYKDCDAKTMAGESRFVLRWGWA